MNVLRAASGLLVIGKESAVVVQNTLHILTKSRNMSAAACAFKEYMGDVHEAATVRDRLQERGPNDLRLSIVGDSLREVI